MSRCLLLCVFMSLFSMRCTLSFKMPGKFSPTLIGRNRIAESQLNSQTRTLERDFQIRELFEDIIKTLVETGFESGIKRTLNASSAIAKLLREVSADPKSYLDASGNLSAPKILRKLFEELGSTYIKLGQFIASSPTLFPPEYVLEFQACLDNAPTIPYSIIKRIIQDELKKPLSSVYNQIDPVPLATASIAQVHRARLRDGADVVIKVQKPDVAETLKADLGFLYSITRILEFIQPSLSKLSLAAIVGDIRASMLEELDFKLELQNLEEFRSFLSKKNISDAVAPKPYAEASSTKVLTMEFLRGTPLIDLDGIRKFAANPEATLVAALRTWAISVAENDFFHADVHAGNLLVLEDGRVGFIDFGIVGRISDKVWAALNAFVQCIVVDDFDGIAEAMVQMGATSSAVDTKKLGRELREVVTKITNLQPELLIENDPIGSSVTARLAVDERETTDLVLQIVDVAERNGLKLPREFGLLLKQALYFDRYQKLLAPSLDPLRDDRVRQAVSSAVTSNQASTRVSNESKSKGQRIIDAEVVDKY